MKYEAGANCFRTESVLWDVQIVQKHLDNTAFACYTKKKGVFSMNNERAYKIHADNKELFLRVVPGHFATSHSHINYYIDVTTQKTRLSEARAVAEELVS